MPRLTIIGFGPGADSLLTLVARDRLDQAQRVLHSRRLSLTEIHQALKETVDQTVVMVSGDSGFYSLTKTLLSTWSDQYVIEVLPGISSLSYFCAKIQQSYDDAVWTSRHGRSRNLVALITYHPKVLTLTSGQTSVNHLLQELIAAGLGELQAYIGQDLSLASEQITVGTISQLAKASYSSLAVICLLNPKPANHHQPLTDQDFVRGSVPMTKQEVRWLALQQLAVQPTDVVLDIGAGTGSVAIELARRAYQSQVYAIEASDEGCQLIAKNRLTHQAYNLQVIAGLAPAALPDVVPDKAFIGGSQGQLEPIIRWLINRNPTIRLVVTAITLQTLHQALTVFKDFGLTSEISCLNVSKAKRLGEYDLMMAQNPIYLITAQAVPHD